MRTFKFIFKYLQHKNKTKDASHMIAIKILDNFFNNIKKLDYFVKYLKIMFLEDIIIESDP
jgi:hypothetical protein